MFDRILDKIFLWAIKYVKPDKVDDIPKNQRTICFGLGDKKAYEKLPAQQIRRQYFYTCRMFMDEGKWREECESMGADEKERKEIVYEMSQVKPEQMAWNTEEIDEMLSDFKKEYHRSTGF